YFSDPRPFPCIALWEYAVVNNDGGVAPCCGRFYREDDVGQLAGPTTAGSGTFPDGWNGPRRHPAPASCPPPPRPPPAHASPPRPAHDEARRSIGLDCPQTVIWDRWQHHWIGGGTPDTFRPGFGVNDIFMYFWRRRGAGAKASPARRGSAR